MEIKGDLGGDSWKAYYAAVIEHQGSLAEKAWWRLRAWSEGDRSGDTPESAARVFVDKVMDQVMDKVQREVGDQ